MSPAALHCMLSLDARRLRPLRGYSLRPARPRICIQYTLQLLLPARLTGFVPILVPRMVSNHHTPQIDAATVVNGTNVLPCEGSTWIGNGAGPGPYTFTARGSVAAWLLYTAPPEVRLTVLFAPLRPFGQRRLLDPESPQSLANLTILPWICGDRQ